MTDETQRGCRYDIIEHPEPGHYVGDIAAATLEAADRHTDTPSASAALIVAGLAAVAAVEGAS